MEPVSVDRRAELGRRAREAVTQLHENRVALGEIALEVAPWSRGDTSNTGALQALEDFIEQQWIDLEVDTLRRYRHVVGVWWHGPDGHMQQLPDLPWAVLKETAASRYDGVRQEIADSTPEEYLHGLVEAGKLDKGVVERALRRTKDVRRWTVELAQLADPGGPEPHRDRRRRDQLGRGSCCCPSAA